LLKITRMKTSDASLIYNVLGYSRKQTFTVEIGGVAMGGNNPIRVQTMTTTNTNDVLATVEQAIRAINAGAEYVRITTQGVKEARALEQIKRELSVRGISTPIIADIHFNPKAAIEAALHADKVRVNPGNYADKSKTSEAVIERIEYEQELQRAEERFLELIEACKKNGVAIRIGVNQGSLSQRIMNRYGDTPMGMAQSAMEFVRICKKHNFQKIVVSMKSSNTRVMVQATRLLVSMMNNEELSYPLHLGVTEAGEGEDGRIKSAVGIGTLLVDGIGDTIRVSLTEEPENEIPVAKTLTNLVHLLNEQNKITLNTLPLNPFEYKKRDSISIANIGGANVPAVIANLSDLKEISPSTVSKVGWLFCDDNQSWISTDGAADFILLGDNAKVSISNTNGLPLVGRGLKYNLLSLSQLKTLGNNLPKQPYFIQIDAEDLNNQLVADLGKYANAIVILVATNPSHFYAIRNAIMLMIEQNVQLPVVVSFKLSGISAEDFPIIAASLAGPLFLDGLCNGIMLKSDCLSADKDTSVAFAILQAARVRITRTEFISCPGCGRTLFGLNQTLLKVKERTAHLKGLKIAVMGCIVNGPGEMADADYGYVGSGPGLVSLYKGKNVVKKNIPEDLAVDELLDLIKTNGDWLEPQNQ
jgi:(E)-4-hydroxy-3-methylbut-2-enyl-diphosphate synthase